MATRKQRDAAEERKARGRFMDQPGQWKDATPASVKKRRNKALAELSMSMQAAKKR